MAAEEPFQTKLDVLVAPTFIHGRESSFQPHLEVLGAPTLKSARQECKDETKNNLAKTPSDTQQITILNAKVANMALTDGDR